MRKSLLLALPALALGCTLPAGAVRANTDFMTVTQPDGSTLTIQLVGDERAHFTLSEDGALLTEQNGEYFFGRISDEGLVVSTGVRAANPGARSEIQNKFAKASINQDLVGAAEMRWKMNPRFYDTPKFNVKPVAANAAKTSELPQYGLGRCASAFPNTGEVRTLVLLVEYQDVRFTTPDPKQYFSDLLNKDGFSEYNATGCAAEYFRENSNNQFIPTFDVLGPVTLSENMAYYGQNSSFDIDVNAAAMVVEGLQALDDTVDFSVYDMNHDGVLDNVFIFYAGRGEATGGGATSVWPHSSSLDDYRIEFSVDGLKVNTYGCTNEMTKSGDPDGVGTFIHEFSHVIGLPDLYDTRGSLACTPDLWSVLDYGPYCNGGHTPPNYSAYELNAMKWVEPILLDGPEDVVLENLGDSRQYRLIQTERENEFFLLENRQQKGWDKYLPGHGMLIWHVDWNESVFEQNIVNNRSTHQYVHLKKANNLHSVTRHDENLLAGWAWPGTTGATEFTASTQPAFKSWAEKDINLPITDIREEDGVIYFLVDGGVGIFGIPTALAPEKDEIGSDWFVAKWEPIDIATEYLLTVKTADKGGDPFEVIADMGSSYTFALPAGWKASEEQMYSTNGAFGAARPSFKMDTDNTWLLTEAFKADIEEVSFWCKGIQSVNSTLDVMGIAEDGSEVKIKSYIPTANKAETVVIDEIPEGIKQVKFIWHKGEGTLALDDVKIARYGLPSEIVEGYDRLSTGAATSHKVTGLSNDTDYIFYVEATDGEEISHPSKGMKVSLSDSNVKVEIVDETMIVVSGHTITASAPVSIYDLSGAVLATDVTTHTVAAPGLYLVRTAAKTHKLIVR